MPVARPYTALPDSSVDDETEDESSQPQLTRFPDRKDALQRTYGGVYSLRDLKVCLDRTQKLQCPKVDQRKFLLVDPQFDNRGHSRPLDCPVGLAI